MMNHIKEIMEKFQESSDELKVYEIKTDVVYTIYYFITVSDVDKIEKYLVCPLYSIIHTEEYIESICNKTMDTSVENLISQLKKGTALVISPNALYFFDANKVLNNKIGDSQVETTLQGPTSSLSEDIISNLNLIRHRYQTKSFKYEQMTLGHDSKTTTYILYDHQVTDNHILSELKHKLSQIDVNMVQSSGQLENLINGKKRSLFPTMMITNRPDRIALNLSQGKIVVLLDGTPFALIVPSVFFDFMSSMDDLYVPYWVSRSLIALRYLSLILTIILPALYIAVVSFNPEFFRIQLALSIAGSRGAVPYPSYLEVLFMLFITEALTEASIRLPKFMGGTATTVGGLILGQAAQQAGLVSSIMIILTAAVTISNFVIPINMMSFSVRIIRYPLILLSSIYGLIGLMVGLFAITCYLVNLRSFGVPYLKLYINEPTVSYMKSSIEEKGNQ